MLAASARVSVEAVLVDVSPPADRHVEEGTAPEMATVAANANEGSS